MEPSRGRWVRAFVVIAAVAGSVPACSSSAAAGGDPVQGASVVAPPPPAPRTAPDRRLEAASINNRGVEELRLGVTAADADRPAEARGHFESALAHADAAIEVADGTLDPETATYAIGWANRAYALWKLGRLDDAAAAAWTVLRIESTYQLNPDLVAALATSGHFRPAAGSR